MSIGLNFYCVIIAALKMAIRIDKLKIYSKAAPFNVKYV